MKAANILENTRTGSLMDGYQNSRHSYCVMAGMHRILILLAFALLPFIASGQIGINARYISGNSGTVTSQKGFHAGLEYHFRLKSNRIEFHPMLGYRRSFQHESSPGYYSSIDFDFNTDIYPFDFEGDCNCPTFSKQGTLIKKGLFLEFQPGLGYQTIHIPNPPNSEFTQSSNAVFKLGGAVGLDIGLSDHYTMSPFISLTKYFSGEWEVLYENGYDGNLDNFIVYGAGVRLTHFTDESRRGHRY